MEVSVAIGLFVLILIVCVLCYTLYTILRILGFFEQLTFASVLSEIFTFIHDKIKSRKLNVKP